MDFIEKYKKIGSLTGFAPKSPKGDLLPLFLLTMR